MTNTIGARRGFTLIELLVVIAIIAILAAFLIPNITKSALKAKIQWTAMEIVRVESACENYSADISDTGSYPEGDGEPDWFTANLLQVLHTNRLLRVTDDMLGDHPRTGENVLVDAFKMPLKYRPWRGVHGDRSEGHNLDSFDLWSAGPDGAFTGMIQGNDATKDNLTNWSQRLED